MKTITLISNPLLGILNPRRHEGSKSIKRGGEKIMAKKKVSRAGVHRPKLVGRTGNLFVPGKSRIFAEHAGQSVNWNPKHHKHSKRFLHYHHNPMESDFWKNTGLLGVGVLAGAYLPVMLSNLAKRITWFQTNATVADLGSTIIASSAGLALTFMKKSWAKNIGTALLITPIGLEVLKYAGTYVPSIYLPVTTTATAIAAATPASATTTPASGTSGMENIVPIRGMGGLQTM